MQELQIPTRPILVDVLVTTGEHIIGSVFVPQAVHLPIEADVVMMLLADERRFVPLAVTG